MADAKIEIGYAMPKERWNEAAENLMQVGLIVAKDVRAMNFEGRGKEDADEWMADVTLACTALRYVAEFAADKRRMIIIDNTPRQVSPCDTCESGWGTATTTGYDLCFNHCEKLAEYRKQEGLQ